MRISGFIKSLQLRLAFLGMWENGRAGVTREQVQIKGSKSLAHRKDFILVISSLKVQAWKTQGKLGHIRKGLGRGTGWVGQWT